MDYQEYISLTKIISNAITPRSSTVNTHVFFNVSPLCSHFKKIVQYMIGKINCIAN